MASSERAKLDFQNILNAMGRKYEIIHTKWLDNKSFESKFRTQIPRSSEDYNGLCDEWVDLFSEVTNTVWAKKISNTGPKIRFRKQYQCWTQGGKVVQKELLFDARRCRATLDIKVLTDNPLTRRKNKHIRIGLNVVVKINFIHLHPADVEKCYGFFVHECPPQADSLAHERIPALSTSRTTETTQKSMPTPQTYGHPTNILDDLGMKNDMIQLQNVQAQPPPEQQILSQLVPLQDVDGLKLLPHQYAQVVVGPSNLDLNEPLLMCQSLMFDASPVVPVASHSLTSYVTIHTNQLNNQ